MIQTGRRQAGDLGQIGIRQRFSVTGRGLQETLTWGIAESKGTAKRFQSWIEQSLGWGEESNRTVHAAGGSMMKPPV